LDKLEKVEKVDDNKNYIHTYIVHTCIHTHGDVCVCMYGKNGTERIQHCLLVRYFREVGTVTSDDTVI